MGTGHVVLHHHRRPSVEGYSGVGTSKLFGCDADDREVMAIERDAAADDVGIAAKAALPQPVADDDDRVCVGRPVLFGQKRASDERVDAEDVKVVAGHDRASYALGLASASQD